MNAPIGHDLTEAGTRMLGPLADRPDLVAREATTTLRDARSAMIRQSLVLAAGKPGRLRRERYARDGAPDPAGRPEFLWVPTGPEVAAWVPPGQLREAGR